LAPRPNSSDRDSFGLLAGLNPLNDPPRAQGSAYDGGWEGYLQRALRQALNPRIPNGYSQVYCGGRNGRGGNLASCRAALKSALQSTIDQLTSLYGSSDPARWTCSRANDNGGADPVLGQYDASKCKPEHEYIAFC